MTDRPSPRERERAEAARLFEEARKRAAQADFAGAKRLYEQSLRLHEDPAVRAAYMEFLATIGPM